MATLWGILQSAPGQLPPPSNSSAAITFDYTVKIGHVGISRGQLKERGGAVELDSMYYICTVY